MGRIENIADLRAFEAVARLGSLSAAARDLGVPLSVLSKRLARLERILGERLAERSTRTLRLTAAGQGFLKPCQDALKVLDQLEDREEAALRGRIRITGSVAFSQRRIAPCLPAFLEANPGLTVELLSANSLVDLVREGIDLAFRQLDVGASSAGERIAPDRHLLVASPGYLSRHGTPENPDELEKHRCLTVGQPGPRSWVLQKGRRRVEAPIRAFLTGSDGEPAHAAALADGGIAMKSTWDVLEDLASGKLVQVLPGWNTGAREIRAIVPSVDHRPRAVVALIQHLRSRLQDTMSIHSAMFD